MPQMRSGPPPLVYVGLAMLGMAYVFVRLFDPRPFFPVLPPVSLEAGREVHEVEVKNGVMIYKGYLKVDTSYRNSHFCFLGRYENSEALRFHPSIDEEEKRRIKSIIVQTKKAGSHAIMRVGFLISKFRKGFDGVSHGMNSVFIIDFDAAKMGSADDLVALSTPEGLIRKAENRRIHYSIHNKDQMKDMAIQVNGDYYNCGRYHDRVVVQYKIKELSIEASVGFE
jgi:hypothetical protein